MRIRTILCGGALLLLAASGCSTAGRGESRSIYERVGGDVVISAAVRQTVLASQKNELLKEDFQDVFVPRLVETFTELVCERSGGPCTYRGLSMESSHRGMNVTEAQMNEFVEEFREALIRLNVQEREINELIGVLAPLKREIVYR